VGAIIMAMTSHRGWLRPGALSDRALCADGLERLSGRTPWLGIPHPSSCRRDTPPVPSTKVRLATPPTTTGQPTQHPPPDTANPRRPPDKRRPHHQPRNHPTSGTPFPTAGKCLRVGSPVKGACGVAPRALTRPLTDPPTRTNPARIREMGENELCTAQQLTDPCHPGSEQVSAPFSCGFTRQVHENIAFSPILVDGSHYDLIS